MMPMMMVSIMRADISGGYEYEYHSNHKPPVKRVVCRRATSPYHYDQRLKALAFTLFKPLCPSYSATP